MAKSVEALISWAVDCALVPQVVSTTAHRLAILDHVKPVGSAADLKLDDPLAIGYTLKCLAAGLFGLRSTSSFADTLQHIARQGGDADTNGAVCGALLGAKIGYRALPAEWLQALPHKAWLDRKVAAFFSHAKLNTCSYTHKSPQN